MCLLSLPDVLTCSHYQARAIVSWKVVETLPSVTSRSPHRYHTLILSAHWITRAPQSQLTFNNPLIHQQQHSLHQMVPQMVSTVNTTITNITVFLFCFFTLHVYSPILSIVQFFINPFLFTRFFLYVHIFYIFLSWLYFEIFYISFFFLLWSNKSSFFGFLLSV